MAPQKNKPSEKGAVEASVADSFSNQNIGAGAVSLLSSVVTIVGISLVDTIVLGGEYLQRLGLTAREQALLIGSLILATLAIWSEHRRKITEAAAEVEREINDAKVEAEKSRGKDLFVTIDGKNRQLERDKWDLRLAMQKSSEATARSTRAYLNTYCSQKASEAALAVEISKAGNLQSLESLDRRNSHDTGVAFGALLKVMATDLAREVESYLSVSTGQKESCRVSIQILETGREGILDPRQWMYIDSFWDEYTERELEDLDPTYSRREYPVSSNSIFTTLLTTKMNFFAHHDLTRYVDEHPGTFKVPDLDWGGKYNAVIVMPIGYGVGREEMPVIFGFLTVDSPNRSKSEAFSRADDTDRYILRKVNASANLLCATLDRFESSVAAKDRRLKNRRGAILKNRRTGDITSH